MTIADESKAEHDLRNLSAHNDRLGFIIGLMPNKKISDKYLLQLVLTEPMQPEEFQVLLSMYIKIRILPELLKTGQSEKEIEI